MRIWIASLALGLSACAPSARIAFIPAAPDPASSGALILALESSNRLELWVPDPEDGAFRPPFQVDGVAGRLFWIRLVPSLAALGLRPGVLEPATGAATQHLPQVPEGVWSIAWDGAQSGSWEPAALTDSLRSFPLPATGPTCTEFDSVPVELGLAGDAKWMLPLGPDAALVNVNWVGNFAIGLDGISRTVSSSVASIRAGYAEADGTLWFAALDGIYRGRVNDLRLELKRMAQVSDLRVVSTFNDPAGLVLFFASLTTLYRYTAGSGLETLAAIDPPFPETMQIAALGRDEVLLVGEKQALIRRYRAGAIEVDPDSGHVGEPMAVAQLPNLPPVIGNAVGGIFMQQAGSWTQIGDSHLGGNVNIFTSYEDRLLIGADHGALVEWSAALDFCPVQILGTSNIYQFTTLGDRIALGLSSQPNERKALVFLIRGRN